MIGSVSLLVALAGFLVLAAYLVRTRHEDWGRWAASMPLAEDPPLAPNAPEETA